MTLGDRIRNGVKWLLLGSIGNRLLEFGFGIILARLLIPEDFGIVLTLQLFTGFVGVLTSGGMGQSLVRAKHADEHDFNTVFTLQLGMGISVYLIFFMIAPSIGDFYDNPLYGELLQVSTLVFLLRPLALMRNAWLTREMAFKKRSLVMVASSLTTGISGTLMAFAGMGVWALVLSGLLTAFVRNILLAYITPLTLRIYFDKARSKKHSSFGVKITILEFLGDFKQRIIVLILSKMAGPAFLGLFNKADSLAKLPSSILIPPVGQTTFRAMSKIQDNLDQTKYLFYKVVTMLAAFVFPFFTLLWWIATPFIGFVYGDKWLPAAEPLQIMSLAGYFITIGIPCGIVLTAQNRLNQQIVAQTVNLVVIAISCLLGLQWGLTGVAWGMVFSQIFAATYYYTLTYKTLVTSLHDLRMAVTPGIGLNIILFLILAATDHILQISNTTDRLAYLIIMGGTAILLYSTMILLLPIPLLKPESDRLKSLIRSTISIKH